MQAKYFDKNLYFWEDGASYRLQRLPGKECHHHLIKETLFFQREV